MPLSSGTRLGPYQIVSTLGVGGMGEVYRASDTNLGRDIAVKVLPRELASDVQRMACPLAFPHTRAFSRTSCVPQ